jgi:hypothetical protein
MFAEEAEVVGRKSDAEHPGVADVVDTLDARIVEHEFVAEMGACGVACFVLPGSEAIGDWRPMR